MYKRLALLVTLVLFSALLLLPMPKANAQSKTIMVPDDYPNIASAIGNSTDGDTILIKSGNYQENAFYTNKSLSVKGEGYETTIINLTSHSHQEVIDALGHTATFYDPALTINATNFVISGLTIRSNGGAISFNGNDTQVTANNIETICGITGANLFVKGNYFSKVGFSANYSKISQNTIIGDIGFSGEFTIFSSNDITNEAPSIQANNCLITDNSISNAPYAIFPLYGNSNIFSNNVIDHLSIGLWVSGSNNTIIKNQINHCGIALQPSPNNTYYGNSIANNLWGVDTVNSLLNPNGNTATFYNNNMENNRYQVGTLSTSNRDYFDNNKVGNYWSDYNGVDLNGDGFGDTPYFIDANRSDRYPLIAPLNISDVPDLTPNWAAIPVVQLTTPTNTTYSTGSIALYFLVNKQSVWIGYSLDGQDNVTISGNGTITNLSAGFHNITVYSSDLYHNIGSSTTVSFRIIRPFFNLPFLAAFSVLIAIICITVGLLFFRRHRKTANLK